MLTDAGRRAYESGAQIFRDAERHLFSSLTADDTANLSNIFEKLERAID